jgi:3-oxoacyl-[acyl-carrier protein] reductase
MPEDGQVEGLGRSALVTGGSRGIGLGIAKHLASRGWDLTLSARDEALLASTKAELEADGARVEVYAGDVADERNIVNLVKHHEQAFGTMHALILAAGVGSAGAIDGYPVKRLDKQLAVNFRAPFILVSHAMRLLKAASANGLPSRVIALTSIEGVYPEPDLAAYGATKAALISLIRSINQEVGAKGVHATAISPAFVATDMSAWVADKVPLESMIQVADVVSVVDMILRLSPLAVIPHIVINRAGASAFEA